MILAAIPTTGTTDGTLAGNVGMYIPGDTILRFGEDQPNETAMRKRLTIKKGHTSSVPIATPVQATADATARTGNDIYWPARCIRNAVSSGTGRPVAPFAAPLFQAVPAMSRWAQVYLRV